MQPNILLVTVDCLRRDRISAYGYDRRTTPFLDDLLGRALHCTSAHSVSSWTCPSVISLLTGLYPHRHGGGIVPGEPKNLSKQNLPTKLSAQIPMLHEVLADRGYASTAIGAVWNAHLSIPGRFPEMHMIEKPAPALVHRARAWIRRQDRPFFMWLHLGDAHEPLDVPRSMRHLFGRVPRIPKVKRWDYTRSSADVGSEAFRRYREARMRLYDVAIRSVDASIAELWRQLGEIGVRSQTILVITSDHGEEFWEHRDEELQGFTDPRDIYGTGHGHNLFQVHLLVPLILVGPGIEARPVERNVGLVDVVPSLTEAIGLDPMETDGRSLLSLDGDDRPILAEGIAYGSEKRSVVMGNLKLLAAPGDRYERVFRLGPDRRELAPVNDEADASRLRAHLPAVAEAIGEQITVDEEIEKHLRDLGYLD